MQHGAWRDLKGRNTKKGLSFLRGSLFSSIHLDPLFIVFAGQRRIRRGEKERERESIFSHFSRLHRDPNKPYRYEFLLPFTSPSSPSFLISVNFDKYIDPKVSTASETFVSKGAFFSSDFEFDLETGFPFLQSSYCIYIYINISFAGSRRVVFRRNRDPSVSRPRGQR